MKRSNIIVIAFTAFIVISSLIFYIDGKKKEKTGISDVNLETVLLPKFSVIVAEENSNVLILESDTIKLKLERQKDSLQKTNKYSIINDTLHLYKGNRIYVYNKNIRTIISKKASWVGIQFEKLDSLYLDVEDTKKFTLNVNTQKCNITNLTLNVLKTDNLYFNSGLNVKNLEVNLINSDLYISDGIYKTVSANLKDKSILSINRGKTVGNITAQKDSTSNFNIYN